MIFIFGSRLFGKTLDANGLFHVATKCYHVQFLPLIPTESLLILEKTGGSYRGIPIGIHAGSYGVAWLRWILWIALIVGVVFVIVGLCDQRANGWIGGSIQSVAAAAGLIASYRCAAIGRATHGQAMALVARAREHGSLTAEGAAHLCRLVDAVYGLAPMPAPAGQETPVRSTPIPSGDDASGGAKG